MTGSPDPSRETSDLMTIGQFSALARISVRMLRHYDRHGVLTPAAVDGCTGYRRYAGRQLETAVRIRRLRDAGFGVSAISTLLTTRGTPAHAQALAMQRDVLGEELRAVRQRIALLDRLVAEAEHEQPETAVNIVISEKNRPAETVVALRDVIPDYQSEGRLWDRFLPEVQNQNIRLEGSTGGATNHDEGFKESDVDTSVWAPVAPGTTAQPPLTVVERPAERTVTATLTGPISGIPEAVDALSRHLAQHDMSPGGPLSMRYLTDPRTTAEADLVTELSFPIA